MSLASNERDVVATALQPLRFQSNVSDLFAALPLLAAVMAADCSVSATKEVERPNTAPLPNITSSGLKVLDAGGIAAAVNVPRMHMQASRIVMSCNAKKAGATGSGLAKDGCECVICQEPLNQDGELHATLKALPCGHSLHTACLQQWVKSRRCARCPSCRAELPVEFGTKPSATGRTMRASSLPRLAASPPSSPPSQRAAANASSPAARGSRSRAASSSVCRNATRR